MPIAKTHSQPVDAPQVTTTPVSDGIMHEFDGVPVDLYRYFNVNLGELSSKEASKLKDIHLWAKERLDEPSIGNIIHKIANLEAQIGAPHVNEQRWDRMWNWVKITRTIDDLERERQAYRKQSW